MTQLVDVEARLWEQRIEGYIGDPDGKFCDADLKSPNAFLKHVAEAYDIRRLRCDSEVGQVALAHINTITGVLK
jgi:hypothetical protein